jgi:hypothetical protein
MRGGDAMQCNKMRCEAAMLKRMFAKKHVQGWLRCWQRWLRRWKGQY